MQTYELSLLVDPDIKADDQKSLVAKIEKLITTAGGKVDKVDARGRVELVYPIKKKNSALFSVLSISMPETELHGVERKLAVDALINRYLLVRKD